MAKTNLTIRIDLDLKAEMQQLAENLGMDLTTFITIYAKKAVREQRIPFEVSCYIPNEETLKAMEDVKNGRNLSREYSSVEETIKDLPNDED